MKQNLSRNVVKGRWVVKLKKLNLDVKSIYNYFNKNNKESINESTLKTKIDNEKIYKNQKKLKCQICGLTIHSQSHLTTHIQTVHEGQYKNKCELCGKVFSLLRNLTMHIKAVHENVKIHQCDVCDKTFTTIDYLKFHITNVHEEKVRRFKCEFCAYASKTKIGLERHIMSIHEKVKNYK